MKAQRITLESNLMNLSKARDFVSKMAREAGAHESDITKIEISCDEWCANIVEYGLGDDANEFFTVECKTEGRKFLIIFEHEGERFNPVEQEIVDINEQFIQTNERGLGIYIMRKMMDELHYEYIHNSINRLTLIKHLNAEGDRER